MADVVVLLLFLIVLGVCVGIAGFGLLAEAVARYREADARVGEVLADTLPEPVPVHAVLDVEPGINLALADECELLYSMDARHPGLDRTHTAIRDEQKKGD